MNSKSEFFSHPIPSERKRNFSEIYHNSNITPLGRKNKPFSDEDTTDYPYSVQSECPHCGNNTLHCSPALHPHHERLDYLGCGKFIRWVGSPKNESNDEEWQKRVEAIPLERLKAWPHTFIADLQRKARITQRDRTRFRLSQKQIAKIEEIERKLEGVAS